MITEVDIANQSLMVHHQKTVARRNTLLTKAPHIGSHTVLRVSKCYDEYVYEDAVFVPPYDERQASTRQMVREWAVYTEWDFEREACDNVISCNPYFPRNAVCKNIDRHLDDGLGAFERDAPFSYSDRVTTQRVDACQPICYEKGAGGDNLMGLFTQHAFNKCFVSDALLLAFYMDPSRRVIDREKEILENSAFRVTVRLGGNPRQPVNTASIPPTYCLQYGLDIVREPHALDNGQPAYMCKEDDSMFSLSNLIGNVLSRSVHIGVAELARTSVPPEPIDGVSRLPPTREYLTSHDTWLANVNAAKRPLPFPLKLSDLGIVRGTTTEWLVWTDEFADLNDGRNDQYGGRLVERAQPVPVGPSGPSEQPPSVRSKRHTEDDMVAPPRRYKRQVDSTPDDDEQKATKTGPLRSVQNGVERYRSVLERHGLGHIFNGSELVSALVNQTAAQGVLDAYSEYSRDSRRLASALEAGLKQSGRVNAEVLGYSLANSAITTGVERRLLRRVALSTKSLLRIPSSGAGILQLVSLIGIAVDLFSAFVFDPLQRYRRYLSDRTLASLAAAELAWNTRTLGVNRLVVRPYDWIIGTPYYDPDEEMRTTLAVLPSIIQARSVNSNGSVIRHDTYNYVEWNNGTHSISFINDNTRTTIHGTAPVLEAIDRELNSTVTSLVSQNRNGSVTASSSLSLIDRITKNALLYYILLVFILTCVAGVMVTDGVAAMFTVAALVTAASISLPLSLIQTT